MAVDEVVRSGAEGDPETARGHLAARRASGPGPLLVSLWATFALAPAPALGAEAPVLNGFLLDTDEIDAAEIRPGGPPRDGIPALDLPPQVSAGRSPWADDERVLGVSRGGEARAYPISILVWHELVNDVLGGRPILVSFCPLCGTGMVFDRHFDGRERSFGVSGLLYRSDLLLYDRQTKSLWSQISATAITGPSRGTRLRQVRATMTSWARWREAHPHTTVLSRDTGHVRDYGSTPYGDYAVSDRLLFPAPSDRRYHPKTPTLGLRIPGGPERAYPAGELLRAGGCVEDTFEGHPVRVAYRAEERIFEFQAPQAVEVVEGFWFAWSAFHPETGVFTAGAARGDATGPAVSRPAAAAATEPRPCPAEGAR
jgi:hypothetical protein